MRVWAPTGALRVNGFNKYILYNPIFLPIQIAMAQTRPRSKLPSSRRDHYDEYTQDEVPSTGESGHCSAEASVHLKPGSWSDGRIDNERTSGCPVSHHNVRLSDEVFTASVDTARAASEPTLEQQVARRGAGRKGLPREKCSADMTPQRAKAYCGTHCLYDNKRKQYREFDYEKYDVDGGGNHGDCASITNSELSAEDGDAGRDPLDADGIDTSEGQALYSPSKTKVSFTDKDERDMLQVQLQREREIIVTANGSPTTDEPDYPREDLPVTCVDILANIFSIGSYLLDVGSDIWMAYLYYTRQHWWWFTFTITAVIVPSLVMTVFSLSWYIQDHRFEKKRRKTKTSPCRWISRFMFLFLQIAPVLRYV